MANRDPASLEITPEVLLKAYACGIFPMAESADDPALHWIEPALRGIIPLDEFHIPSRLARTVRSDRFTVAINRNFDAVLDGCAAPQPGRQRTWINARIRALYRKLYERRFEQLVVVPLRYFDRAECLEMIGDKLGVEQFVSTGFEARDEVNECHFRGVALAVEHAFTKECASK